MWYCGGRLGRNVCINDCYVGFVSGAHFDRLYFGCVVLWGKEGFSVRTGVCVIDGFVYQGDESTAAGADSVLPDGGEVMECGCFLCAL